MEKIYMSDERETLTNKIRKQIFNMILYMFAMSFLVEKMGPIMRAKLMSKTKGLPHLQDVFELSNIEALQACAYMLTDPQDFENDLKQLCDESTRSDLNEERVIELLIESMDSMSQLKAFGRITEEYGMTGIEEDPEELDDHWGRNEERDTDEVYDTMRDDEVKPIDALGLLNKSE